MLLLPVLCDSQLSLATVIAEMFSIIWPDIHSFSTSYIPVKLKVSLQFLHFKKFAFYIINLRSLIFGKQISKLVWMFV